MSNVMGRKVNFGDTITQRSDGTWSSDYSIDVLDDEPMPNTPEDMLSWLRSELDVHPALRAIVNAGVAAHPGNHPRQCQAFVAVLRASANPLAVAWVAKRNVRPNP